MKRFLNILFFIATFLSAPHVSAQCIKGNYSTSSVLATGQWFKIAVTEDGIYKVDFTKLRQLGLSTPSNPRIFGNNFGQLSYYNNDPAPDDLKEISILLVKGSDGIFNEGDYLLFYGRGTHQWRYNKSNQSYDFVRHNYSDTAYYFITSTPAPGKIISDAAEIIRSPDYYSSNYDALYIHENETENLIKSGREWYQRVNTINGTKINPGFTGLVASEKVEYSIRVLGRSSIPALFRFYERENLLEGILVPEVNLSSSTGLFARIVELNGSALPSSASPSYEMKFYNNGEQLAKGWIDYIKFHGRALISFSDKTIQFSDFKSVYAGRITEFTVRNAISAVSVWDVSDQFDPKSVRYTRSGDNISFKTPTDSLRTFVVFTHAKALNPVIKSEQISNQNLHSSSAADMIIVTHPMFRTHSEKLADLHFNNDSLISLIATPEEIYNEFSGGIPDIAAIRNFIRMKYLNQKGTLHPLKYLLLFGDGSFQNKILPPHNPNFIPTYQSQNSNIVVSSFTSDDFYGLLENNEGEAIGTEDIGIGRLPVNDTLQAGTMVSKIARYLDTGSTGNWRNVICIVADDEDGNTHSIDAESLSSLLDKDYPSFNIDKIYLDAYRQVISVNGQSYPDVTQAINNRINSGCLIFNYLGHGNEIGLAHERVVKTENINSWKNSSRLPLFITATCEFSRFDDVELNTLTSDLTGKNSAGEMVLLNPEGGGIALMTTTRVVYSAPNYTLNRNIYNYAFTIDSTGNSLTLGDIIKLAKRNSGDGQNKRNFLLLGDPAMKLAYPWHGKIVTDSINNISVNQGIDSLQALSLMTVSGHLENNGGNLINNFNGSVYPLVYDKMSKIRTLANDGGQTMEFNIRNNILFSGKTKAGNGKFKFTFIVPKDIDYSYGTGKISYYANQGSIDMSGAFQDIIVGGFTNSATADTTGPEIRLYLNDTLFRNGGISDKDPILFAIIEDQGGINTTGSGIGHDLTAQLDKDRNKSFVLNNYFETDLDNYKKGRITYPLRDITGGNHSLTLKAWDNFNNSSEESITFLVETARGFILNNLLNYPNPFSDRTNISAEHNRPYEDLEIQINVYNISGKIIKIITISFPSTGFKLPPITWDGTDAGGKKVGRGIYPYTVIVSTRKGETVKTSGRMIIL